MKRFFNLVFLKFKTLNFNYITPILTYILNNNQLNNNKINNKDKASTAPGTNNIKNHNLNVVSLIFIVCLLYYFIMHLTYYDYIGISISFVYSFLIYTFVLDNFKYSNNIFVKYLQEFVMFNIIIIITLIIGFIIYVAAATLCF